jgi:hypothetical protein
LGFSNNSLSVFGKGNDRPSLCVTIRFLQSPYFPILYHWKIRKQIKSNMPLFGASIQNSPIRFFCYLYRNSSIEYAE